MIAFDSLWFSIREVTRCCFYLTMFCFVIFKIILFFILEKWELSRSCSFF